MSLFSFISIAHAETVDPGTTFSRALRALTVIGERGFDAPSENNYQGWNNPFRIFWFTVQSFFVFLGILVFIGYLYAGWLWMTSRGNSDQTGKALRIFLQTSLGLLVIFAAYAISFFALSVVTRTTGAPELRDTDYEIRF